MPFEVLPRYILAKFGRECYELNCLWAAATGFNFIASDAPRKPEKYPSRPTIEQWAVLSRPAREKRVAAKQEQESTFFDFLDRVTSESTNGGG